MHEQSVYLNKVDVAKANLLKRLYECFALDTDARLRAMTIGEWSTFFNENGRNLVKKSITFLFRTRRGTFTTAIINAFGCGYQHIWRSGDNGESMEWTAHGAYLQFMQMCASALTGKHAGSERGLVGVPVHVEAYCNAVVYTSTHTHTQTRSILT
jgi:hypothetical protein